MTLSLLVVALAPGAALFLFFYLRDRYRREPLGTMVKTFILGAAALIPSMAISMTLQNLTGWRSSTPNMVHAFFGAMIIVGLVEEGCKFIVVRFYSYRKPDFDEPYDGIMYSVMAALGFAAVENVLYVLSGGPVVGALRAAFAVPSHAFNGVVMGYFLGEAKFAGTDRAANWLSVLSLAMAVLAHGLYDFIVFSLDKAPFMLACLGVFVLLSWVIIFRATRHLSERSPYKHPQLVDLHSAPLVPPAKDDDKPSSGAPKPD